MDNKDALGFIKDVVVGKAKNLSDEKLFHNVSLIALFAWVGLGVDGLSSSCYGPEEAFRALGEHYALSVFVGLACLITIGIICASYWQIIEVFPGGGGGYLVASKLLSPAFGAMSGCALLVDYVLTIALSISSGADALFSVLPATWIDYKLAVALAATVLFTILNIRGAKESVLLWVPIFFIFLGTHLFAILFTIFSHIGNMPDIAVQTATDLRSVQSQLGIGGMLLLLIRSYSVGAGTYTGIEAVSNGLQILREPRVATGKRTMIYMGVSLGVTVGGLFLAYLLYHVEHQPGKTLNASLFEIMTRNWHPLAGGIFVQTAMISSMALLFAAAQTGFLGGPRIMANMAIDRWLPTRFASLSDRLVTQNGVMLMGISAVILISFTRGSVGLLVVLYSINVFITFTLSQFGMMRHWWQNRRQEKKWIHRITINTIGFALTLFILVMLSIVKFNQGGWVTLLVTGFLMAIAFATRRHYKGVMNKLARLRDLATQFKNNAFSQPLPENLPCDTNAKTAVIFVSGFNGLGVHTLLTINKTFGGAFSNFVFIQAGVVDAGNFKGSGEIEKLKEHIKNDAQQYSECMMRLGYYSESVTKIGTDVVETAAQLAVEVTKKFENSVFFGGQLVFENESFFTRFLHNYTVFAMQRKLFKKGLPFLVLPIRV